MKENLNTVFDDFSKSLFSRSDKQYKEKYESSYIQEHISLENANYMSSIAMDLDTYSDDRFLDQAIVRFRRIVGKEGKYQNRETIGTHPDFTHLENTDELENHYIVSMFLDIKGSTSIFLKTNDLIWTKTFKNTVLRIATIFIRVFDGHVHRLQGDAIFSYFGWKDKCKEDAIIDSLNASSFLLWYIENTLNSQLEELGYDPLKIRIGIDFGQDEDVLWSEYGLSPATEVTTTSLHTDLAAKLQSKASENTILIGDNIKEFLDLPKEFIDIKKYQKNNKTLDDKYILDKPEKRYKMWIFKHKNYLKYFPALQSTSFNLSCTIDNIEPYSPNIRALDKEKSLEYIVDGAPGFIDSIMTLTNYKWSKENRGKEARDKDSEGKLTVSRSFENKAHELTSYRGHHIMKCDIVQRGVIKETLKFGIFIK